MNWTQALATLWEHSAGSAAQTCLHSTVQASGCWTSVVPRSQNSECNPVGAQQEPRPRERLERREDLGRNNLDPGLPGGAPLACRFYGDGYAASGPTTARGQDN